MKFMWNAKDGGPESKVWAYGLELKSLFSVLLLRFETGSREAYHSHAFKAESIVLGPGSLVEQYLDGTIYRHSPGKLVTTLRSTFHKVTAFGTTWVLSFRGPWSDTWQEYTGEKGVVTLTHGRKVYR